MIRLGIGRAARGGGGVRYRFLCAGPERVVTGNVQYGGVRIGDVDLDPPRLPNSRSKFLFYFLSAKTFLEEFAT